MAATRVHEFRTLTSPIGQFIFSKEIPLSCCKIVRDAVTSQYLKPIPGLMLIRSEQNAHQFMLSHVAGPSSHVNFELRLAR